MLIIQLVLSKNEGLNSVEGMGIQSRKVEPTLIPYVATPVVTTTRQRTKGKLFFFIFLNAALGN